MVDISPEQVLACLWDFPKASALGPSGWRAQYILELVTGLVSTVCAEALQLQQPRIRNKWVCMKAAVEMQGTGVRAHIKGESGGNGGCPWKGAIMQQRWAGVGARLQGSRHVERCTKGGGVVVEEWNDGGGGRVC